MPVLAVPTAAGIDFITYFLLLSLAEPFVQPNCTTMCALQTSAVLFSNTHPPKNVLRNLEATDQC